REWTLTGAYPAILLSHRPEASQVLSTRDSTRPLSAPRDSLRYSATTSVGVGTGMSTSTSAFQLWIRCAAAAMVQSPYLSFPSIGNVATLAEWSTAAGAAGSGSTVYE